MVLRRGDSTRPQADPRQRQGWWKGRVAESEAPIYVSLQNPICHISSTFNTNFAILFKCHGRSVPGS